MTYLPAYRCPSVKTLHQAGPTATIEEIRQLRRIIRGEESPETVPAVQEWIRQCSSRPSHVELVMCAADALLHGHGVESLWAEDDGYWPSAEHVNQGDAYAGTLLYNRRSDTFRVTSWGDFVEAQERRGVRFR